jgi:hypothetical protein
MICGFTSARSKRLTHTMMQQIATATTMLPAAADLATGATSAIDAVFSFIDQLSWMVAFERIQDKADVLKLNSFSLLRLGNGLPAMIRRLIGLRDIVKTCG